MYMQCMSFVCNTVAAVHGVSLEGLLNQHISAVSASYVLHPVANVVI